MEQVVLTAPDISCDHCIAAIKRAVGALAGVASVDGNPETKQVAVRFDPGQATLEQIRAVMAEEGYPVAASWAVAASGSGEAHGTARPQRPTFTVRLLRDGETAEVGYVCSCGCKPRARYRRGSPEAGHEHCCCGLAHFVGADARRQLQAYLEERRARGEDADRTYTLDEETVEAPWGGPLAVAFALPS